MDKKIVKLYRNIFEEGTAKGSFFITDNGLMTPRTRNVTLWGMTSSSSVPPKYRSNPNVVTSLKEGLATSATAQLPAFFKFQKNPLSGFTEAVAMEIASNFNTKTCYNFPANIDKSPDSLYSSIGPELPAPASDFGSLVFSFLEKDEELISFYKMARSGDISVDFMAISSLVPSCVANSLPNLTQEELSKTTTQIQRDYAYQYLLRDYMGDIDYTSKNAGIVVNKTLGYATLAPNFDYGETMNLLTASKFNPPKLETLEDYPEVSRPFIKQEFLDKNNARRLEKYNAPVGEVAKQNTFDDKSDINIHFICSTFPDVAEAFRQDLQTFLSSNQLPQIIEQYAGVDGLVTAEQAQMCIEYLEARGEIFEKKLTTELEKNAPDYDSLRKQNSTELLQLDTQETSPAHPLPQETSAMQEQPVQEYAITQDGQITVAEQTVNEYQVTDDGITQVYNNADEPSLLPEGTVTLSTPIKLETPPVEDSLEFPQ